VICAPGRGREVGEAALTLGLDGAVRNYVPDSNHVLFHTALVLPGASDRIFFTAPSAPGAYDFICSVPGHFMTMKGVLLVE
jgi:azurin